jgi:transcription elongation factor GreA
MAKKDEFLTDDGQKATLVTKEGLKQLNEELDHLKNTKRREVADRIKEAISYGDLSENSEYEEAKNEQAFVEGRIIELEDMIKRAKIISDSKKAQSIQLGSKVDVTNVTTGKKESYTIVGSTENDPFNGKISNESPLGAALLDAKKGDKVKVSVPAGEFEYKVDKIS